MSQYELDSKAMSYSHLFWYRFTLNQVKISICHLPKAFLRFLCSFKSFLNFRLSSTRLLIKWFLIKKARTFFNFIKQFHLIPLKPNFSDVYHFLETYDLQQGIPYPFLLPSTALLTSSLQALFFVIY